jgi:hypothetical protein
LGEKRLHKKQLLTEKKKIFSPAIIVLRVVVGSLGGSNVASGDLMGSWVALGGSMWPQGVVGGLRGSGVALRVMDGFVGLQMASGAAGHGRPWGVLGGLWGSQLTLGDYEYL